MDTNENQENTEVEDHLNPYTTPAHVAHSHCHKCGAEAHGWDPNSATWWCERCAAADDHKKLAAWFLQNLGDEIKEGGLSDNVIRLLSAQVKDVPSSPEKKEEVEERALLEKPEKGWGKEKAGWAIKRIDGSVESVEPADKILIPDAPGWEDLTTAQKEWCTIFHQRSKRVSEKNKRGSPHWTEAPLGDPRLAQGD